MQKHCCPRNTVPVSGDVINADTIALLDNEKYFRFTAGAIHRHRATVAGSYHFAIYRYITMFKTIFRYF